MSKKDVQFYVSTSSNKMEPVVFSEDTTLAGLQEGLTKAGFITESDDPIELFNRDEGTPHTDTDADLASMGIVEGTKVRIVFNPQEAGK